MRETIRESFFVPVLEDVPCFFQVIVRDTDCGLDIERFQGSDNGIFLVLFPLLVPGRGDVRARSHELGDRLVVVQVHF